MSNRQLMNMAQTVAMTASARKSDYTRHKCFVSYHIDDIDEVTKFLDVYGSEFIPRSVGLTDEDDFVNSTDDEYIKQRIREVYLSDSTVTIVLLGKCTWTRKFVDWEISSSLRNDTVNKRSGLLVIPLPSMNNTANLPTRVADNWVKDDGNASYALYLSYPSTTSSLRKYIDDAFLARTEKANNVNNSADLKQYNDVCL